MDSGLDDLILPTPLMEARRYILRLRGQHDGKYYCILF